jgi:aldehyde:ferredoxin oxidoreductase
MGPVTEWEYESRKERYDKQLAEKCGVDCSQLTTKDRVQKLRSYREEQYRLLTDAAYKKRGWTRNGVPTLEKVKSLELDWIPGLIDTIKKYSVTVPPRDTLPASDEAWS